jgi:hypothetical protein
MSIPEYHSVIYKINTNKKIATRISFTHHNYSLLPKRMDFTELATILSKMQEICFHDNNIDNENTDRIVDLFLEKREKTFMVAISLGYLPGVTNYMDFIDGGAATVQKSDLDFLDHPQPWINELCRAKFSQMPPGESPVTIVMEMIEKYIKEYLMKNSTNINGLYLYVEKTPEHGNPEFLLKYYEKYGFRQMAHEDDEYFYMFKKIRNTHTKTLTKTRVVKFGGRKSRRK